MVYAKEIRQVSLLGSSLCNLSCQYCYLQNQQTQKFYKLLNDEIQQAWKDHSYVNNIKKVFEKIEADPKKTTRLTLWGGEPLIQINNFLSTAKELFEYFPNITFFMIPTNFAWPENIAKQIPLMAQYFDQTRTTTEKAWLHLQLSIDSYKGPLLEYGHHAKNDQYLKNFETIIKEISKIELKNTKIIFDIHPTATGENILNNLSTYEQLDEYFKGMFFLKDYAVKLINEYNCQDKICYGEFPYFPICAVPENSTSEEGYRFSEIIKKAENIQHIKQYINENWHFFEGFSYNWANQEMLTANYECPESNFNTIMILPDGTISECACSFVANRQEYLDLLLEQEQYEEYRLSMARKNYFFNPITATKEEADFNDWYNLLGIRNNYSTGLNLSMAICQELSLSKQISPIYAIDPILLLKHLRQETTPYGCTREHFALTGVPFLSIPGDYRRIFNGEIEYVHSVVNNEYKKIIEDYMTNDKD